MKTRMLSQLSPDERGIIVRIGAAGEIRRRLVDMGVVVGTEIEVERVAPLGDPVQVKVKGYDLALRKTEAEKIQVEITEGSLTNADPGETVTVVGLRAGWGLQRRLADMGVTPGAEITVASGGAYGQMVAVVRGARLALGRGMAAKIIVRRGGG